MGILSISYISANRESHFAPICYFQSRCSLGSVATAHYVEGPRADSLFLTFSGRRTDFLWLDRLLHWVQELRLHFHLLPGCGFKMVSTFNLPLAATHPLIVMMNEEGLRISSVPGMLVSQEAPETRRGPTLLGEQRAAQQLGCNSDITGWKEFIRWQGNRFVDIHDCQLSGNVRLEDRHGESQIWGASTSNYGPNEIQCLNMQRLCPCWCWLLRSRAPLLCTLWCFCCRRWPSYMPITGFFFVGCFQQQATHAGKCGFQQIACLNPRRLSFQCCSWPGDAGAGRRLLAKVLFIDSAGRTFEVNAARKSSKYSAVSVKRWFVHISCNP